MPSIDLACNWLKQTADDNSHGYSQAHRQGPDYDCSSHVLNALKEGGFDVNVNGYTGNLADILSDIGFKKVTDSKCLKGDIYLTPGKHTVMAYANCKVVTAAGDKDGKTGDSSGKEIYCRDFYTPSYGWTYHFRYRGIPTTGGNNNTPAYKVGGTYTVLASDLIVRSGAGTDYSIIGYKNLTSDAKSKDTDRDGALNKGARVTCKDLKTVGGDIWMKIPSGWIAAVYDGHVYVQ